MDRLWQGGLEAARNLLVGGGLFGFLIEKF
jgi:hypothetical protein